MSPSSRRDEFPEAKYPTIKWKEISAIIKRISADKFSTKQFIDVWRSQFPRSWEDFSRCGPNHEIAVGQRLGFYARNTGGIQKMAGPKDDGQLWLKCGVKDHS